MKVSSHSVMPDVFFYLLDVCFYLMYVVVEFTIRDGFQHEINKMTEKSKLQWILPFSHNV